MGSEIKEVRKSRLSELDDKTLLAIVMNGHYLDAAFALLELDRRYDGKFQEF